MKETGTGTQECCFSSERVLIKIEHNVLSECVLVKIEHNVLALRIPDYFLSRTKWLPVERRENKCILLTCNRACSHQTKSERESDITTRRVLSYFLGRLYFRSVCTKPKAHSRITRT